MTEPDQPQQPVNVAHKRGRRVRRMSPTMLFVTGVLIAVVAFVAGTRSTDIYAVVAPVFGAKVSNDTLDTTILQQAFRDLKAQYDGTLDDTTLADGAVRGMVAAAGDKFTIFMDADEANDFQAELNGEVTGVGCEIGVRDDQPTVLRVVADSPAEAVGLKAGDVFVSVNGKSVVGDDAETVAKLVRGDVGTTVKLVVKRGDTSHTYSITRAEVNDPSVRWSVDGTVGLLTISRFDEDTTSLAQKAAKDFVSHGVKSVILDLRNNGGGYLNAAKGVASLWLKDKLVVSEKTDGKTVDKIYSGDDPTLAGLKTVILVNGNTASASEIVSGALQEYGIATLVGEQTYGKGSVQEVLNLPGGRLLKITIARWYTPKGKNINEQGITPDKVVHYTSADANAGRDPQLDAAKQLVE